MPKTLSCNVTPPPPPVQQSFSASGEVSQEATFVDGVLPEVPIRQWVLTVPFPLRFRMAYDAPFTSAMLRILVRAVFASLRRRARRYRRIPKLHCGAVTFLQRYGDAINLNERS